MEDKRKTYARKTTPTYNATGVKAPRYNVKGIGKLGWALGGLKGAQVSPAAARGISSGRVAGMVGGALTGMNSASGRKTNKG